MAGISAKRLDESWNMIWGGQGPMGLCIQQGSKGLGALVLLGSQQSPEPSRNKMPRGLGCWS